MKKNQFLAKTQKDGKPAKKELHKDFKKQKNLDRYKDLDKDFEVTGRFITKDTPKDQLLDLMKLEMEHQKGKKEIKNLTQEEWKLVREGIEKGLYKKSSQKSQIQRKYKSRIKSFTKENLARAKKMAEGLSYPETGKKAKDKKMEMDI